MSHREVAQVPVPGFLPCSHQDGRSLMIMGFCFELPNSGIDAIISMLDAFEFVPVRIQPAFNGVVGIQ